MPRKAFSRRAPTTIIRCIGCNACIAHYHAETPIRCAQNPRTGRERTFPRATPRRAGRPRRRGRRRAGRPRRHRRGARPRPPRDAVRGARRSPGGQARLAGRAPASRELWASLSANYARALADPRMTTHLGTRAEADAIAASMSRRASCVATGARPSARAPRPARRRGRPRRGTCFAGAMPDGRIVVADWGRDSIGLDCAELLAEAGREVTFVNGSIYPGEALHQYHRNTYIARLLRAGVRFEQYLGLESGARRRRPFPQRRRARADRAAPGRRARAVARPDAERRPRAQLRGRGGTCARPATAARRGDWKRRSSKARPPSTPAISSWPERAYGHRSR